MSLSCECGDYDWYYYAPDNEAPLATKRARRCCSCKTLIKVGEECGKFTRSRLPKDDIEDRIYGEGCEIWMSDIYLCERCLGLYWALADERKYCIDISDNLVSLAREAGQIDLESRGR